MNSVKPITSHISVWTHDTSRKVGVDPPSTTILSHLKKKGHSLWLPWALNNRQSYPAKRYSQQRPCWVGSKSPFYLFLSRIPTIYNQIQIERSHVSGLRSFWSGGSLTRTSRWTGSPRVWTTCCQIRKLPRNRKTFRCWRLAGPTPTMTKWGSLTRTRSYTKY